MPEPQALFSSRNAARVLARRTVVDPATQARWTVTELDASGLPGARGATCLLFDGPVAVRRVWAYPSDWARLSDAALVELSWGR